MIDYIGKGNLTGKTDKNNVKIYDGDILEYPEHKDPYVIMWNDDEAGFVCENSTNFMLAPSWHLMKIIGNMRCNPELVGYNNIQVVGDIPDITELDKIKWCGCGDELTSAEDIKTSLCWLCRAFENDRRIEDDVRTNKHYDLIKGRMWMKGNATGKYWSLLCNSRDAQKDARFILGLN